MSQSNLENHSPLVEVITSQKVVPQILVSFPLCPGTFFLSPKIVQ